MSQIDKVRCELAKISFSTAHARDAKNNAICHLLTYKKSLSGEDINLASLYAVCQYLSWLSKHVQEIDDKRILPSQRKMLMEAYKALFDLYHHQKTI